MRTKSWRMTDTLSPSQWGRHRPGAVAVWPHLLTGNTASLKETQDRMDHLSLKGQGKHRLWPEKEERGSHLHCESLKSYPQASEWCLLQGNSPTCWIAQLKTCQFPSFYPSGGWNYIMAHRNIRTQYPAELALPLSFFRQGKLRFREHAS